MKDAKEDRISVYEIGYLIVTSIPEEKIPAEADAIKKIVTGAGATIIADEAPYMQPLEYTMRKKMVSGSYDKYDEAYFGWVKFELGTDKIEAVKKAIEVIPSILRILVVTTVAENTFLGKRAALVVAKAPILDIDGEKKDVAPASPEDMDKSIDEMVKEV